MFICGLCEKTSELGESATRVVLESRERTYKHGENESVGWEIVKETLAHKSCADQHHNGAVR